MSEQPSLDPIAVSRWQGKVDQSLVNINGRLNTVENEIKALPDAIEARVEKIFDGSKTNPPPEGIPKGVVTFRWLLEKAALPIILALQTGAIAVLFKLLYDYFATTGGT